MRKSYSDNEELQTLIKELCKIASTEKVMLWKRVATDLSRPSRQRRAVNLARIDRYTTDNEFVVVPGKVLSSGDITHKVNVAAFNFSKDAKTKINAKGKALSITELLKSNPKAKGVKIIG
jgi:large subunit ribosomal protein L18e